MSERITVFDSLGKKWALSPSDHLATGGEGTVYTKDGLVFKHYLDPEKARRARLPEKVARLQALQHPGIAAPMGALLDKRGDFVGMVFPRVQGEALCHLFTTPGRDARQFGDAQALALTAQMRDVMAFAHAHQALMVDANELNWLVHGTAPVAIDVDSWQLPGFAATAIMPSIRDPKAVAGFTPGSDWFAWAVVTFQLWTGMHPYKGTHPDFKRHALADRMTAQASVFDPRVSVPAAARPLSSIPPALKDWYHEVLQLGARRAPPADLTGAPAPQVAPKVKVMQQLNASLTQERIGSTGGRVVASNQGLFVVRAAGSLRLWDAATKAEVPWVTAADCADLVQRRAIVQRGPQGLVLLGRAGASGLAARTAGGVQSTVPTRAQRLWQSGGRTFALVDHAPLGLHELSVGEVGGRQLVTIAQQWPVSTLSTEFFRGCFVQDCLGSPFVGVLEGQGLVQLPAPQLRGYRVLDGLGMDRLNVWLTAVRKADGETVRLRLQASGTVFDVAEETEVATAELDGAVTSAGVGVVRLDGALRVSKGASHKQLDQCGLGGSARLVSLGAGLGLVDAGEVSRLSLR